MFPNWGLSKSEDTMVMAGAYHLIYIYVVKNFWKGGYEFTLESSIYLLIK